MRTYRIAGDTSACPMPVSGTAVTIGAFDGIHLGHQALLRLVRDEAATRGLETGLVTFDRHPAQVVRPESAPKLLTDLDQKLELLEATKLVDHAVVLTFDEERSAESAEDFVNEVLVGCLHARLVVVGADFHFGHRRRGNVALLQQMGAERREMTGGAGGFDVVGLDLVAPGGSECSSTRVRALLAAGEVEEASRLLGRPHEVRGVVSAGDRRGRELGFPTANVSYAPELCLPAHGIYAGTFTGADGVERAAAINMGRRPTFYDETGPLLLEAFVLDFSGDLYGQQAAVRFVARIRPEERFDSVEALVDQMNRDVEETRRLLGARP